MRSAEDETNLSRVSEPYNDLRRGVSRAWEIMYGKTNSNDSKTSLPFPGRQLTGINENEQRNDGQPLAVMRCDGRLPNLCDGKGTLDFGVFALKRDDCCI